MPRRYLSICLCNCLHWGWGGKGVVRGIKWLNPSWWLNRCRLEIPIEASERCLRRTAPNVLMWKSKYICLFTIFFLMNMPASWSSQDFYEKRSLRVYSWISAQPSPSWDRTCLLDGSREQHPGKMSKWKTCSDLQLIILGRGSQTGISVKFTPEGRIQRPCEVYLGA